MEPSELLNADPDMLPYFITEVQTGRKVSVRFEPLALDDLAELQSAEWARAVFAAVWQYYAGDARTYKLVCTEGEDRRIQGIVSVGDVLPYGTSLRKSLLESAPFNRREKSAQVHRGVGRVMIARLIAESYLRGQQGRVSVVPRPGSEAFYTAIGFRQRGDFVLEEASAYALLTSTLQEE